MMEALQAAVEAAILERSIQGILWPALPLEVTTTGAPPLVEIQKTIIGVLLLLPKLVQLQHGRPLYFDSSEY